MGLTALETYVEDTLDLSGDDTSVVIDVGNAIRIGIEVEGPTGTPTHVGTLYVDEGITESKPMSIPAISFTAGNVVDRFLPLPDVCGQYLQLRYVHTSGGTGETATIRVRGKWPK